MIIALSGPMGSGKSTAIEELKKLIPADTKLIKFAAPLYDIQEMIYNRISSVYTRPKDFKKDRRLLQWIGTDWARGSISENLWADIWKAEVEAAEADGIVALCDDCRFDNEAQVIKDMGGYIIKLKADHNLDRVHGGEGIKAHASEAGIDDKYADQVINNNGTLEEFRGNISQAFDLLRYRRIGSY